MLSGVAHARADLFCTSAFTIQQIVKQNGEGVTKSYADGSVVLNLGLGERLTLVFQQSQVHLSTCRASS